MVAIRTDEAVSELKTIKDLLRWTMSRFNEANLYYGHGTDNPWDEALQLILPTLALPLDIPEELFDSVVLTSEKITIIKRVLARIEERTPVAYLTNKAWFCGYEFYVDERVLIPRSPIGELINHQFSGILSNEPAMILDLCTGSACIAIACAYAFPEAQVDAVDISSECLEVAERNIYSHHLEQRVFPIASDLFNALPKVQYDLIVSNPPYVDAEDMQDLPAEYHKEPKLALAAGVDGLQLVTRLLYEAPDYLTEQGVLICEVGNSQVHLIERYRHIPFTWLEFERGGDGVFLMSRAELLRYHDDFKDDLQ